MVGRIRLRDGLRKQPFFDEYIDELRDFGVRVVA